MSDYLGMHPWRVALPMLFEMMRSLALVYALVLVLEPLRFRARSFVVMKISSLNACQGQGRLQGLLGQLASERRMVSPAEKRHVTVLDCSLIKEKDSIARASPALLS